MKNNQGQLLLVLVCFDPRVSHPPRCPIGQQNYSVWYGLWSMEYYIAPTPSRNRLLRSLTGCSYAAMRITASRHFVDAVASDDERQQTPANAHVPSLRLYETKSISIKGNNRGPCTETWPRFSSLSDDQIERRARTAQGGALTRPGIDATKANGPAKTQAFSILVIIGDL